MNKIEWDNIIKNITPYPWTIFKKHPDYSDEMLLGRHIILFEYIRYKLVINKMLKYFKHSSINNVLDVGVYPGCIPQILNETNISNYKYTGLGMNFPSDFKKAMNKINVKLIEADLDPRLNMNENNIISEEDNIFDCVILTDVIEHFFDPFYLLKQINKSSKKGSFVILTTDNLVRFHSLVSLLRGQSISIPLIESHIFYNGEWRPHFREYSIRELVTLLKWSGYSIEEHSFFNSEFGRYKMKNNEIIKTKEHKNLKGSFMNIIEKVLTPFFPHLKNHHILVAKKIKNYNEIEKDSPFLTNDINEWHEMRKRFN